MWLGHFIEHLMCIGGELEHHKALPSPARKTEQCGVLCSLEGGGIYRHLIGPGSWLEPGLKVTPLVPVPNTNRDQCASLLAHNHWSRFVGGTGTNWGPLVPVSATNRDQWLAYIYPPAREESSALLCFFGRPWESFVVL